MEPAFPMSDRPTSLRRFRVSLDAWAVFAATVFVLLVVAGLLPAFPW
jgi:hypothetical protein